MTILIDTHCHIHDVEYSYDDAVLERAKKADVYKVIVIGTHLQDNLVAKKYAGENDGVFWSYGFHPGESGEFSEEILKDDKLVAVGEIGLDYHYKPFDRGAQIKLFERMLELANKTNLPVIFHVREAFEDFWPIVDNARIKNAVLHSYSDDKDNLEQALNRDYFVGVNGLVTFAPIPLPPLEKMLLETDAPFLTPTPFRGKVNEPAYVKNIAEWISTKTGVELEVVADITTRNARELFGI
jgi:TatD DNase family protein